MDPDANVDIVTAERVPDPLTGLSDRRLLVERLTQSIERLSQYPGYHFAVLCVDLVRPGESPAGADAADPADGGGRPPARGERARRGKSRPRFGMTTSSRCSTAIASRSSSTA